MPVRATRMRELVEPLFHTSGLVHRDGAMGAELELIPVRSRSRKRVGIAASNEGPGTADIARAAALREGWIEQTDPYGSPSWMMPGGGRLTYEPGGQMEISSPVFDSIAHLEGFVRETVAVLREPANAADISLLTVGVDPYNDITTVPLVLHAPRYDAMTRHFDSIGPSGARMMRQTASLQVSVELGAHVMHRWALLNALAPYLVAAFANSPTYAGAPTGYASYRAHLWQTLDRTRTGMPFDAADPVGAYSRFASDATRILSDDEAHLTTLFPEVRPRAYFEIRSIDSMEPDRICEALRFVSSLVHDVDVAAEAARVIGDPDPGILERAARFGRTDPFINRQLDVLEVLAESSSAHVR
jgi:glutamate--cysteine ligase